MALYFDEIANDVPAWAKECLSFIASEEYDKALKAAFESFEGACRRKDTTGKVVAYLIIAKVHFAQGEFYEAKEVAEKGAEVLGKGTDVKLEAALMGTLAKVHLKLCKFPKALEAAEVSSGMFARVGSKAAEAAVLTTVAEVHLAAQKKTEALKVAKQALATFRDINEKHGEASALVIIVKINKGMKKFDDALRSANEIVGIYEGTDDATNLGAAMLEVSDVRQAMGDAAEAEELAMKAVELFEENSDSFSQARALRKLADTCFANNNPTDGWTYVKEARNIYTAIGNNRGVASVLCQIALENINVGKFEDGEAIASECITLCRENDLQLQLANVLWTMADGHMAEIIAGAAAMRESHINWMARQKAKEALAIYQKIGDLPGQAKCLNVLAMAFISYGNVAEGKAKAKAAVQLCKELEDKQGEGINLLLWAQARVFDNSEEATRLARLADKLLKEAGSTEWMKGAEEVLDWIKNYDKGGKKEKEGKIKLSDIQTEKSDTTMDLDYGRFRGAYFHGFTARAARTGR